MPALAVVVALFGGALVGAVHSSVTPLTGVGRGALTLAPWRTLLHDPAFGEAVLFTARITLLATLLSAALGLAAALALRGRRTVLRALAALPVPVPHLLAAVVAVLWLGPGGLAERLLGTLPADLVRDRAGLGVVVVYVYKEAPFLALLVLAGMGRGLAEREELAATMGASPWQRLRWVVWPAVRGPLVAGSIVVSAFVVGAFEVPLTIGPNAPLTVAEYAQRATENDVLTGESVQAAALLVAAVIAIVLAAAAVRLVPGGSDG